MEELYRSCNIVGAPMVDQSELAFRMLCRKYGVNVCFTPMFHARLFVEDKRYFKEKWTTCEADRPLVVQVSSSFLLF